MFPPVGARWKEVVGAWPSRGLPAEAAGIPHRIPPGFRREVPRDFPGIPHRIPPGGSYALVGFKGSYALVGFKGSYALVGFKGRAAMRWSGSREGQETKIKKAPSWTDGTFPGISREVTGYTP
jgi:hypothetical protein